MNIGGYYISFTVIGPCTVGILLILWVFLLVRANGNQLPYFIEDMVDEVMEDEELEEDDDEE